MQLGRGLKPLSPNAELASHPYGGIMSKLDLQCSSTTREGIKCKNTYYLVKCKICKGIVCGNHVRAHGIKCETFEYVSSNETQDERVSELEA